MTDLISEPVPATLKLAVPIEVDGDALAVSLVNSGNSYDQLLTLIQDIDSEVGDWDFTKQAAHRFVALLQEFAADEEDSELLEALQRLLATLLKS